MKESETVCLSLEKLHWQEREELQKLLDLGDNNVFLIHVIVIV